MTEPATEQAPTKSKRKAVKAAVKLEVLWHGERDFTIRSVFSGEDGEPVKLERKLERYQALGETDRMHMALKEFILHKRWTR